MAATGRRLFGMASGKLKALDSRALPTEFAECAIPGTGFKNQIINGDFQIAQRGVQFATPANSTPLWDQWYNASSASTSIGTSNWQRFRMFEDLAGNGAFGISHPRYLVLVQQSVGMTGGIVQRLTCWLEDVRRFVDCNMTLSFIGNADASRTLTSRMLIFYGTGGSPSGTIEPTSGNVAHSFTTTVTKFNHTATFPSLSGKTIGTDNNDGLVIQFEMPITGTFTFRLWDIQLEYGSTATAFERIPIGEQLRRCQRYYCKTFNQDITPAQNTGNFQGSLSTVLTETAIAQATTRWQFPVTMRTAPSLVTYNPAAANADWRNLTGGVNYAATVEAVGDAAATIRTGTIFGHSGNQLLYIHAGAEAGVRV